jgi:O-antigen ligase
MASVESPQRNATHGPTGRRSSLFLVLATGLFAYVSLVPFYYLEPIALSEGMPPLHLPKYLPFLLAFLLALVAGVGPWRSLVLGRAFRLPVLAVLTYLAIGLLSLSNAAYLGVGLAKWLYYGVTGYLLCLVLAVGLASWSDVRALTRVLVVVAAVVAAYTTVFSLLGQDYLWGAVHVQNNPYYSTARAVGPFGNPVSTATYLIILMPFMVWIAATESSEPARLFGFGALGLSFLAVLLTQTRASVVTSGVALLVCLPLLKRGWLLLRRRTRRVLAVIAVTTIGVLGVTQADRLQESAERWRHLLSQDEVTVRHGDRVYRYDSLLAYTERFRVAQYYTTLNMLREYPLLGVGFGNFSRVFPEYRYSENYETWEFGIHTTDNMFLMALAETGILGLLAIVATLAALVRAGLRGRAAASSRDERDLLLAFLASACAVLVSMLAWDLFNDPTVRITFWMVAGLALATVRLARETTS